MALTQKDFITNETAKENNKSKLTTQEKKFIKERFDKKHLNFRKHLAIYEGIDAFAPNGNVFNTQTITDEAHFIMRTLTQYYLTKAFESMKIDLNDNNVTEVSSDGNIGTPGRIAKVWCGSGINDNHELGSGRWAKKPRLATFPNTSNTKIPITKRVDVISNCSHHFITFSTIARPDSYAIVSYIPDRFVLGISKLQRLTDWISQRFWLQEDLTKALYDEISKAAETDSVYVGIVNATHGCESFRGAKSKDGAFTSEYYGGEFNDINLRHNIKAS